MCQLHKDVENEKSYVFAISEFLLKDPLLSFAIYVAKERREKSHSVSSENNNQFLNGDDESDPEESAEHVDESDIMPKERLSVVTLFATNKVYVFQILF